MQRLLFILSQVKIDVVHQVIFDVEIVFFYPFATIFAPYMKLSPSTGTTMLITILLFVAELLVAYVYAWAKGVFRWD